MSDLPASRVARLRTPRVAVSAFFLLNGGLFGIWASRVPAFVARHELSPSVLGLLLLCMGIGAILSFPVAGRASDSIGAVPVSRWLGAMYAAALLALPLMPNVWTLGLVLLVFGAGHGGLDVSMNAFAAEVERRARRPMMSSFHALWSVGAGLGAASGYGAVEMGLGPGPHFWIAGLALAVLCLSMSVVPWEAEATRSQKGTPLFVFPTGALFAVGLIALAGSVGEGAMADWSAVYLVESAGADEGVAALGYATYSVVMVTLRLFGDRITALLGAVRAARFSGIAALCGALLTVSSSSVAPILAGFALLGVGYAVVVPLVYSRAANDPEVSPGRGLAAVATLGYGAILMGPPLLGAIAGLTSLRVALGLLAVLALLMIALAGRLSPSR
ncbi:MFS transporter [Tropicimonas sp. IMCC34011]|uniref:MFS transporter n=1 Tax=Tropicimonas sp. IMCC34011 TaxID=2248759 RepID=UPI000E253BDE|nr:MFS transporter [Tropicimonas sp. IMCC34011]